MDDIDRWFYELMAQITSRDERAASMDAALQQLENAGVLSKVTVHQYICVRGCGVIARVVKLGGSTLCRTRDHKMSRGMNLQVSVESARRKRTLDGERHWPGHTFDVEDLAKSGAGTTTLGIQLDCRHQRYTEPAAVMLAKVAGIKPGLPGKPTLLATRRPEEPTKSMPKP